MRSICLLVLAACLAPVVAGAQTFDEYLQIRKQYGITHAADVEAIELFVGKKILEVRGTVKGMIGSDDAELLLVEGPDGVQHFVRTTNAPEWLTSGSVQARMIVEAERESDTSVLKARLLGVATEHDVAAYEEKVAKADAARTEAERVRLAKKTSSSRHGGRPQMMQGDIPGATTNPIGQTPPGMTEQMVRVLPSYVSFIKSRNKKLSDRDATRIAESILAYSGHFGVDPRLIVALVIAESDFDPTETSSKGAKGLGQLMPGTLQGLGLTDAYSIEQNLWGTVRLVRGHIDKYMGQTNDSFEALVLALAGYNAGSGAVKKWNGVPPYKETQNYVRKVISIYSQLCGK